MLSLLSSVVKLGQVIATDAGASGGAITAIRETLAVELEALGLAAVARLVLQVLSFLISGVTQGSRRPLAKNGLLIPRRCGLFEQTEGVASQGYRQGGKFRKVCRVAQDTPGALPAEGEGLPDDAGDELADRSR